MMATLEAREQELLGLCVKQNHQNKNKNKNFLNQGHLGKWCQEGHRGCAAQQGSGNCFSQESKHSEGPPGWSCCLLLRDSKLLFNQVGYRVQLFVYLKV